MFNSNLLTLHNILVIVIAGGLAIAMFNKFKRSHIDGDSAQD